MQGKSFETWFKDIYISKILASAEQRVSNKTKELEDLKKRRETAKSSRSKTLDGHDRETYFKYLDKTIRQKQDKLAGEKKTVKKLKEQIAGSSDLSKRLKDSPRVKDVFICQEDFLNVITIPLKHDIEGFPIGSFRIVFKPENNLKIINLVGTANGYDHWGINPSFSPCLGQWNDGIWTVSKSGDLFIFVDSLISYLSMAGDEGAYMRMPDWRREFRRYPKDLTEKKELRHSVKSLTEKIGLLRAELNKPSTQTSGGDVGVDPVMTVGPNALTDLESERIAQIIRNENRGPEMQLAMQMEELRRRQQNDFRTLYIDMDQNSDPLTGEESPF